VHCVPDDSTPVMLESFSTKCLDETSHGVHILDSR